MKSYLLFYVLAFTNALHSQSYTSYFTGNPTDTLVTDLDGGICMMGGAAEHDEAMKWFLQRCKGGDVLVLRASGSNGYNAYLYNQLGIKVHSVETIVCHDSGASLENYLHQKIQQAEGIWFAGGDQWDYVSYWRNSPIDSLINIAINDRKIAIGGTSAGMAILGRYYFSAQNGTVTSSTALANPYSPKVSVDSTSFLQIPFLDNVITDTHYDNPDRKGRHVVFLARMVMDWGAVAKGIACDENTAICIPSDGIARVYGDYPDNDDNAWFIQTNCELDSISPEECSNGQPLTWNRDETALKVYAVKGTFNGANTFDLNNWFKGIGGDWQNWYVLNGIVNHSASDRIHCQTSSSFPASFNEGLLTIYPNPFHGGQLILDYPGLRPGSVSIYTLDGTLVYHIPNPSADKLILYDAQFTPGGYIVQCRIEGRFITRKLVIY
jgi:cyanophycinase-like exopeptidase